jgi:toxin-antitoxin system PIN domain toxin
MAVYLLDVNVLVALGWEDHEFHLAAHEWFRGHAGDQWATCPMTQCGFVRISSNSKAIRNAVEVGKAIASLERMIAHPRHVFWEDSIELCNAGRVPRDRAVGHRQVTDLYLFALCLTRGGKLATFDRGVLALARTGEERNAVEVIGG